MKKIIKVLTILLLSFMLVACLPTLETDNSKSALPAKVENIVYVGLKENKKEYLIYYDDGSTQTIFVAGEEDVATPKFDINDLYQAALDSGYTGTILDFIGQYIDGDISNNSKSAIVKGLKSSVSIFANFERVETTYLIPGVPKNEIIKYTSAGSGIIYKLDKTTGTAYIITNHHVVHDINTNSSNKISKDIEVYLYGQELAEYKIKASYVGGSETHDIAVLKVENSELLKNSIAQPVSYLNSELVDVGDVAIAIGNPEARGLSATEGIISVTNEYIMMPNSDNTDVITYRVMRIDAGVNSGNSGGGLFNNKGEIIGIVNAKMVSEKIENIGYAIPANIVFGVADNIIHFADNKVQETGEKVFLGVTMQVANRLVSYDELMDKIVIKETINVKEINEGSLASEHFLEADEIVSLTINGITYELTRLHQISDLLFKVRKNETITFTVIRNNESVELNITFKNENFNVIK